MISFFNKCTAIITPSEAMRKELITRGLKKEIYAVSNGIDIKKFPYSKRKKRKPTFISTSRLVESKHIDTLLKAFSIFKKRGVEGEFIILGKGPEEKKLKEYTIKNKLSEYVQFKGFVNPETIIKEYQKSDAFLTASTIETEGITTLEAMSTGLPVIGVDARATPLLVKKGTGFIAPVGDEKKIAEYMEKLAKDYKLRQKMGKAASKIAEKYELKKMNKKLYETYKKVIDDYKKQLH